MNRWEGLDEFVAVAECGQFTAAAERLSLSSSQVSRQIARLEERLQTRLFYRSTRRVALTEAGLTFLQHCQRLQDAREEALRAVGDLPRGIVAQWKRWCASPDFVMSEGEAVRQAYAAVTVPITAVLFTDDNMASPEGIRAVHAPYTQAPVQYLTLSPKDVGARAVGRFHFFHPHTGPQGWRASLPWLGLA